MLTFRKLNLYIINSYYNNDNESKRYIYEINTIFNPNLIYEYHHNTFYGKMIIQGNYIVSITKVSGYLIDIMYLRKKLTTLFDLDRYLDSTPNIYMIMYDYKLDYNWRIKLCDTNSIIHINRMVMCFKYIKLDETD